MLALTREVCTSTRAAIGRPLDFLPASNHAHLVIVRVRMRSGTWTSAGPNSISKNSFGVAILSDALAYVGGSCSSTCLVYRCLCCRWVDAQLVATKVYLWRVDVSMFRPAEATRNYGNGVGLHQ